MSISPLKKFLNDAVRLVYSQSSAVIVFLIIASANAQAGVTYRVGPGCTYATIQAAINAIPQFGFGTIRIRSGTYQENLIITAKSAELLGGHGDCSTTSATGRTNIDGAGGSAVAFFVTAGAADLTTSLLIDSFLIFNGAGSSLSPGGGLNILTTGSRTANVTLQQTIVRNNESASHGGGISLEGSGQLTLLENSQIDGNAVSGSDPDGGGLYCEGDFSVQMIGGSIRSNRAGESGESNGRGGGVFLDGCSFSWFAQAALATSDDASLRNNTAYGNGGGLYARGGAQVNLFGASFSIFDPVSVRPLLIRNNQAEGVTVGGGTSGGSGGGVFASGFGTEVTVDRVWTHDNEADAVGGAFAIENDAFLEVIRSSETCHNPRNCSRVFDNHARIAGGAIDLFRAGALVQRTIIARNDSVFGSFSTRGSIDSFESFISIEDSLMYGDVGPGHAIAATEGALSVLRSTIADTAPSLAVFGLNGSVSFQLEGSIVHEADDSDIVNIVDGTPGGSADCVVWHDDALSSVLTSANTAVADPRFADRDHELYYLSPDSPAINYCGATPPASAVDLDWNPRGICHSVPVPVCPVDQIYDLGAYEFPLGIFSDRFESSFL